MLAEERHEVGRSTGCVAAATISRQLRGGTPKGGGGDRGSVGRRSSAKVTGERVAEVAEEAKEEAAGRVETAEVEGGCCCEESESGVVIRGGVRAVRKDDRQGSNNEDRRTGVTNCVSGGGGGSSGGGGGSGGGVSCKGGTLRLLRGLVEGPIGRVAARVHRWGTAGGVNPSAPSGRECPGGEGTPRRNVLDATKNRRLMGANLTKQSRVSCREGIPRVPVAGLLPFDHLPSSGSGFLVFFSSLFLSFWDGIT